MSKALTLTNVSTMLRRALTQAPPHTAVPFSAQQKQLSFLTSLMAPTRQQTTRPSLPYARKHFERRTVPFTPSELYDVVADVEDYHAFVPWCTRSRITSRVDDKHLIADLSVGFQLLSERYTSVITLDPNRCVSADVPNSSLFEYLITDWHFEPAGEMTEMTNLTFYVEFAFRNPLYQRVTDLFFQEVVKQMVGAFENRCFAKYRASEGRGRVVHRW